MTSGAKVVGTLAAALFVVGSVGCGRAREPSRVGPDDFDRAAALSTMSHAATVVRAKCSSTEGPHGGYRIAVTFDNGGQVTASHIEGPFETAPIHAEVRSCVERVFRDAVVPPFQGMPVTVHKTFVLD
jgi:hypothetical protein